MVYGHEDEGGYDEAYDGGYEMYQDGGQGHAVEDPYYNEYDVDQMEEQQQHQWGSNRVCEQQQLSEFKAQIATTDRAALDKCLWGIIKALKWHTICLWFGCWSWVILSINYEIIYFKLLLTILYTQSNSSIN